VGKALNIEKDRDTAFFNIEPNDTEIPPDVTNLMEDTKIMQKVDLDDDFDMDQDDEELDILLIK
jgi:hypothetical protein